MISPAHVPSVGVPDRTRSRNGSARCSRSMPSVIVVDSPPGITDGVEALEVLGGADVARHGAQLAQQAGMGLEAALERQDADGLGAHQPRV